MSKTCDKRYLDSRNRGFLKGYQKGYCRGLKAGRAKGLEEGEKGFNDGLNEEFLVEEVKVDDDIPF